MLTENENISEISAFKTDQNSNLLFQSKLRHFKKMRQGMKGQDQNEEIQKLGVRTTKINGNKKNNSSLQKCRLNQKKQKMNKHNE